MRATGIAWGYAVTLGCLLLARQSWIDPRFYSETLTSRFYIVTKSVCFLSPYIALTASLFVVPAIPLAVWSIGSVNWKSLKRSVYAFWTVLAIFTVASGNADGLILISGVGLIIAWFINGRKVFLSQGLRSDDVQIQTPPELAARRPDFAVLIALTLATCSLSLFFIFGNSDKRYVSEVFAVYAIACSCQGIKTILDIMRSRNSS